MIRKALDKSTKMRLSNFYGDRLCVVTRDPIHKADYHHLDDNSANTTFVNVIPLDKYYNQTVLREAENQGHKYIEIYAPELSPDRLRATALDHFDEWRVASAYGCARLSSFIARNYFGYTHTRTLAYIFDSLYFTEHCFESELIEDVLNRDILPITEQIILSDVERINIVLRMARLFSNYKKHKEAAEINDALPPKAITDLSNVTDDERAGFLRRRAFSLLALGENTDLYNGFLKECRQVGSNSLNLNLGLTVVDAWSHLANGKGKEFLSQYGEFLERLLHGVFGDGDVERENLDLALHPVSATAANVGEVFDVYACFLRGLGGRYTKKSRRYAAAASRIFRHSQGRPYMLLDHLAEDVNRQRTIILGSNPATEREAMPIRVEALIRRIVRKLL